MALPETSLVSVQLPGALEPVLETMLHETLGELADAAKQADRAIAAGLGGRFPFLGNSDYLCRPP